MRRRVERAPVSLFAFQDIMTGTIGVVLLIMLVLALELSRVIDVVDATDRLSDSETAIAERVDLESRVKQLESELADREREISQLAGSQASDPVVALRRRRARLRRLYDQIAGVEADLAATVEEVKIVVDAQHRPESESDHAVQLEQRVARLKAELERTQRSKRLTYIVSQGFSRQPILVEVSDEGLAIGGVNEADAVLTLADPDAAHRVDQLLAYAGGISADRFYFLLLIKPTGVLVVDEIEARLRAAGFQVGLDLLPEDWTALIRSADQGD